MVDPSRQDHFIRVCVTLADQDGWASDARDRLAAIRLEILDLLAGDAMLGKDAKALAKLIRSREPFSEKAVAFLMGYATGKRVHDDLLGPFFEKEHHRRTEQQKGRKASSEAKAQMVRTVFSEYAPSDVQSHGKKMVYKEVGEVAAKRLGLSAPISARAVRRYLGTAISGHD